MQKAISYIKDSLKEYYTESEISGFIRIIAEYITGKSYPLLFTTNHELDDNQIKKLDDILNRLKKYEPIQYISGETEFFGMPFFVNNNTLIPRPETEELVELIVSDNKKSGLKVLDIGTGSGAIAVALAKHLNKPLVSAWDFSQGALDIAKQNAVQNKTDVTFEKVDVLEVYPINVSFDIIVSNPPYVLESEKKKMDRNVLDYEPHSALFIPDNNALIFYERIADIALNTLVSDGRLYFEINQAKGDEVVQMMKHKGFVNVSLFQDLNKNDRMVRAKKI